MRKIKSIGAFFKVKHDKSDHADSDSTQSTLPFTSKDDPFVLANIEHQRLDLKDISATMIVCDP